MLPAHGLDLLARGPLVTLSQPASLLKLSSPLCSYAIVPGPIVLFFRTFLHQILSNPHESFADSTFHEYANILYLSLALKTLLLYLYRDLCMSAWLQRLCVSTNSGWLSLLRDATLVPSFSCSSMRGFGNQMKDDLLALSEPQGLLIETIHPTCVCLVTPFQTLCCSVSTAPGQVCLLKRFILNLKYVFDKWS